MLTQEDLKMLEALLDKKMEPIKEDAAITREAVNYLMEWVERIDKEVGVMKMRMPR